MPPASCDVLIVGAGPVGLAAAITLLQAGFRPLIIEREPVQQTTSRAAVIHAHTLEVLSRIGVSARLVAEGRRIENFAFRDRDSTLAMIRFNKIPSDHPYLLMLPQDRTEAILTERLIELGGQIARNTRLLSFVETERGIRAELETADGRIPVSAKYLIGADGMHSIVRETLRIPFEGSQYEGSFVLADVSLDERDTRDEVSLFFSPEGLVVLAPLPGSRYRVVATIDDAPEKPDAALVQHLLDARGPASQRLGRIREVTWSSRFRLHHRLALHYRCGRAFLAGDAAHVHSPAGGQGMNTGLVDAYVLGQLMSEVLSGRSGEVLLNRYEALRRPAAKKVMSMAGFMTTAATLKSPWKRALRNIILKVLSRSPQFRERLALNLSGIARRSAAGTGLEAPQRPGREGPDGHLNLREIEP